MAFGQGDLSDEEQKEALFRPDRCVLPVRPEPDWGVVRKELSRKGMTLSRSGMNTSSCIPTA